MLGDLIADRYRVEAELGRGGMGVVLRAHDTRLNRTVAVKMLPEDAAQSEPLRQRLSSEARIASALNHPGIATVTTSSNKTKPHSSSTNSFLAARYAGIWSPSASTSEKRSMQPCS
jgi:serine/threonine protein kinase